MGVGEKDSSNGSVASAYGFKVRDLVLAMLLIQTTARWIRMNETGFPRGSADQERAAEPEAPPTLNLEEFRADRDLAEVAIAWLAELPEKLELGLPDLPRELRKILQLLRSAYLSR